MSFEKRRHSVATRAKISKGLQAAYERDPSSWEHTEASKKRMSIAAKKVKRGPLSKEHRENIGRSSSGHKHTVKVRARMSATQKIAFAKDPSLSQKLTQSRLKGGYSAEMKTKISAALKGRPHPKNCNHCKVVLAYWEKFPQPETGLERILYDLLCRAGFRFERQHRLGKYFVDAYLPDEQLAFEADGEYWHSSAEKRVKDTRRDAWLLAHFGVPVVRLSEYELLKMEGYL